MEYVVFHLVDDRSQQDRALTSEGIWMIPIYLSFLPSFFQDSGPFQEPYDGRRLNIMDEKKTQGNFISPTKGRRVKKHHTFTLPKGRRSTCESLIAVNWTKSRFFPFRIFPRSFISHLSACYLESGISGTGWKAIHCRDLAIRGFGKGRLNLHGWFRHLESSEKRWTGSCYVTLCYSAALFDLIYNKTWKDVLSCSSSDGALSRRAGLRCVVLYPSCLWLVARAVEGRNWVVHLDMPERMGAALLLHIWIELSYP